MTLKKRRLAELTISRISAGNGDDQAILMLRDPKTGTRLIVEAELTDFALAMFGRSAVRVSIKTGAIADEGVTADDAV